MTLSNAVEILAVPGIPLVRKDDDLVALIGQALARGDIAPRGGDVFVLTQKIVSKAEGRMVDLATVEPSTEAIELAAKVQKDPRLVELILSESVRVVRARTGILIVEHRLGFVMANAGIDQSNVASPDEPQRALLLPVDPDGSAAILRGRLSEKFGVTVAVIISDSFGRAWRRGTWCRRRSVVDGFAWLARSVRPRASGQHHWACGRDRRCSLARDGPGRRSPACRGRARPDVAQSQQCRVRAGAPGRRGHVPMSKRLVVALSGGVGGAKLALGLSRVLPADELLVVANTGDDFEHLGLSISPDVDTLTYVLAGLDNPVTGWGRRDETWSFMDSIGALGGEDWFRLGDRDLALHVERTRRLRLGQTLSEVTSDICRRLGIGVRVVPMSDDRVRTRVRGDSGWIDFQDYFVRQQCAPVVHELAFDGATLARPQADIMAALRSGDVRAVIICPSNPFISIEPILAMSGMRDAIKVSGAPVVAVSPIIGGQAVKGPTAKMMGELGLEASAAGVAARYGDLLDAYIVDHADAAIGNVGARITIAKTLMTSVHDRKTLARLTLDAAEALASR